MLVRLLTLGLAFWLSAAVSSAQSIIYVNQQATGKNDGSSWQHAYTDLGNAIVNTTQGQLWIARGIYLPSFDSSYRKPIDRRDATFHLHNRLGLYGGFAGWETQLTQRDIPANPTVLSGDFEQNDIDDDRIRQLWMHPSRQDNAYRVVNAVNCGTSSLDGFIIEGGNTKPTIVGDPINDNLAQGAGLYALVTRKDTFNDLTVRNCYFLANASWKTAGGIKHYAAPGCTSHLLLINCLFFNCQAVFAGGIGCATNRGHVETLISNCTFIRNYALYCGGSVSTVIEPRNKPAVNRTRVLNTVFWGNDANGCRPDVDDYNAETSVEYSAMEYPYGGVGNFKQKPFFKNPAGSDGKIGTPDDDFSIYAFCPADNRDSCLPPVLYNAFMIRGKPVQLSADLNQAPLVSLQADETDFGLAIALVGFTRIPDNALEYRLEGYDNQWRRARQTDTIFYHHVSGGNYMFRLRATGTAPERVVRIKIAPAYWQTTWFRILVLFLVTSSSVAFYFTRRNIRLRRRLAAFERAREIENLRNEIAQDIHDEVGAGLTKISLGAQFAALLPNLDPAELRDKLRHLSQEARTVTGQLGEIVFAINPRYDNFQSVQAYFREKGREFLEDAGLEARFELPAAGSNPLVSPDVKRQLYMLYRESLSNTAKHAQARTVTVTFQLTDPQRYYLDIRDDGLGFEVTDTRPFGNGLNGMRARAEKIGATLTVESAPGKGTSVRVEGPV